MSTVILTPSGIVEVGSDFNGNVPPGGDAQLEPGVMFNGNAATYMASPVILTTKQEAD